MNVSFTSAPTNMLRFIFWRASFFFCWFRTPDRFSLNLMKSVMRNFPCDRRRSLDGEWCQPMAVDNFLTRSLTRSLTLLKRLVVRPRAFISLLRSVDECSVAGKLNFRFEGAWTDFSIVLGGASSSEGVKITSGVKIPVLTDIMLVSTISWFSCNRDQLTCE